MQMPPQSNGVLMIDKGLQIEEVWPCPSCVKIFADAKYLDLHKATKHNHKMELTEEMAVHKLVELASKVQKAAANEQIKQDAGGSMQDKLRRMQEISEKKLHLAEAAAIKQVKALEEELRDSTIQIQEAKTQIAVLHSQRQTQITREPAEERESLAQFKQEQRLDHLEGKIENLEKKVNSLLKVNIRLAAELERERLETAQDLGRPTPKTRHTKECQTPCAEDGGDAMDIDLKNLTIDPSGTCSNASNDRTHICAQALWGKERAAYQVSQRAPDTTASCSGVTINVPRCEGGLAYGNWRAMADYSDEDESMEPDCSCSSDTSYESDDSPRRRRTPARKKNKGKVKKRTTPRRGRRPARRREESDSTSSSDSSGTPPRQRVYRTPPRRKSQTYASMNCQRNPIPASQRIAQYNRSKGVSIARRTPRAVDGVEKYDVELWGSDDDDLPTPRSSYKGRYYSPTEPYRGAFRDRGRLPQTR